MYSAIDIANFFIDVFSLDEEHPTNLKLNKLAYYAQGHSYARFNRPLFNENFQAWKFGPVVPSIYNEFKVYGSNGIPKATKELPVFSEEDAALLLDVAREYGQFTASALTTKTHKKGTPWQKTAQTNAHNAIISKESISQYFHTVEPKLRSMDEILEALYDEDGYLS